VCVFIDVTLVFLVCRRGYSSYWPGPRRRAVYLCRPHCQFPVVSFLGHSGNARGGRRFPREHLVTWA